MGFNMMTPLVVSKRLAQGGIGNRGYQISYYIPFMSGNLENKDID